MPIIKLSADSFSTDTNSTIKQRKFPAVKKLSELAKVEILEDFAKSETQEIDGSTSIRYSFVVHYDRWKCLTAAFYMYFCFGMIFYFPKYSSQIKDSMQLSQTELSWLSNVGIIGLNAYIIPGIMLDRIKISTSNFIGTMLGSVGYFGMYLTTNGSFGVLSTKWLLSICFFLANHGMAWIDLAVTSVVIKNFPSNRGLTIGLVQTQVGISPLCMLVLDRGFFGKYNGIPSMTTFSNPTCEKDRYIGRALLIAICIMPLMLP